MSRPSFHPERLLFSAMLDTCRANPTPSIYTECESVLLLRGQGLPHGLGFNKASPSHP
jgi:hypothetical protein